MKQHHPSTGLGVLCGLFGKTRQAYYEVQWRQADQRLTDSLILEQVLGIRQQLPRTGGHKLLVMLQPWLKEHGLAIGRDRFFDLLRAHNLLVRKSRKYVRTTQSSHHYRKWPNLIEKWRPQAPGQLWVSDITYLRTDFRFLYLSLVTDAFSRKIVGYHLSHQLKVKGCLSALTKALKNNQPAPGGLIHHSDRGIQYCCDTYVGLLTIHRIRISMTQSGSPYDNAIAERVNGILKRSLNWIRPSGIIATLWPLPSCGLRTPQRAH